MRAEWRAQAFCQQQNLGAGRIHSARAVKQQGGPGGRAAGVALMRGCDIDKPRNLAKSVTVE